MSSTGRFAPSPTGDLHFGSLLAATASFCEARSKGAQWLLRIDDIDPPRSIKGSAQSIQQSLLKYGMQWDNPVQYQSQHNTRYKKALANLIEQDLVFKCRCSRKSLPPDNIYPGTCRGNRVKSINEPIVDSALRLILPDSLEFTDAVQGMQSVSPSRQIGDIVIWRRDALVSYSLACAVDDALDCTEVIRGADLLPSTAAQLAIMQYLSIPVPRYAHIPLAVNTDGDKLSKHSKAASIDTMPPLTTLQHAWRFLGQPAFQSTDIEHFWSEASSRWQLNKVPAKLRLQEPFDE